MFFYTTLFILFKVLGFCDAHHIITNIHIGGVDQGDGTCVRVPPNTNPVVDVESNDMACNVNGEKQLDKFCTLDAGQEITLEWRTWPDGTVNSPIDISHQGPCSVYLKKVNAFSDRAAGVGWFKIWDYGHENGKFCTEILRESGGMMSVTIPRDLEGGRYYLRGEHLALHQAKDKGGAQWYIGCIQLVINSTGGSAKPSTVAIPGHVKATNPGVLYDYWANMHPKSYIIPGPVRYIVTNAGGGRTVLLNYRPKYPVCLVSNADWCAVPVPNFNDEGSCWTSAGDCWKQLQTCYQSAPPTGYAGCTQWEAVCKTYQNHCQRCGSNRNCVGPFPVQPAIPRQRIRARRAEHRYPLLPPIEKRVSPEVNDPNKHHPQYTRRETAVKAAVSSNEDKLASAHKLCEHIAAKCKKDGIGGLCQVFGAACRDAVQPSVIGQFPEASERKWQALWLYQIACENENFEKKECREKFSRAVWGFE